VPVDVPARALPAPKLTPRQPSKREKAPRQVRYLPRGLSLLQGLEGRCSIQLSYRRVPVFCGVSGRESRLSAADVVRKCARSRQPTRHVAEIAWAHDMVAIEHATGLVAGHLHRHSLRDTGVDHVPHRCASTVMPQLPGQASILTSRLPSLPEVAAPLAEAPTPFEVRKHMGDNPLDPF